MPNLNDIKLINSSNPIKNGTCIVTTFNTGKYSKLDTYVVNTPNISEIQLKYDNRFYNGIFVKNVTGTIGTS